MFVKTGDEDFTSLQRRNVLDGQLICRGHRHCKAITNVASSFAVRNQTAFLNKTIRPSKQICKYTPQDHLDAVCALLA